MTDLGKAYVQIVPSAEGISGSISNVLEPEAESAGDLAGQQVGSNLVSKLKTIIAAAGIGEFIKSAVSEGADYEQAVGGMQTLYKENADTMIKYANEAYKSAQISANEYMETATQFSASLLSSLGGDTEQAAEAANSAIIDMADNANKMGTSMESIQDAYRGFAKSNYTMLDNLSLGYGGTKTEMERLLSDAQKITGVKYDISNLSDVYSAIHVIQTELGITGTSALEAGTTVSGAVNMMKSAWSNLLAQLSSSEGGDVTGAMKNLVTSIFGDGTETNLGVLGTVIPSILNVVKGIGPALITALTASLQSIARMLGDNGIESAMAYVTGLMSKATELMSSGAEMITNVMAGISQKLPAMLASAATIAQNFLSGITTNLPAMLDAGIQMITALVNGILQNLPAFIIGVNNIFITFTSFFMQNLPTIIAKGGELVLNLVTGIVNNLPQIAAAVGQMIGKFVATIVKNLPQILQQGITMSGKVAAGLIQALPKIVSAVATLVRNIISGFIHGTDWESVGRNIIEGVVNGLKAAGSMLWDAITDIARGAFEAVKDFFGIASPSKLMRDEIGKFIPAGIAEGISANADLVTAAMDDLGNDAMDSTLSVNARSLSGSAAARIEENTNVSMTIYGAEGQNVEELANIIADRFNNAVMQKRMAFA
jgi:phage-related protein